jgi:hypothetical protein
LQILLLFLVDVTHIYRYGVGEDRKKVKMGVLGVICSVKGLRQNTMKGEKKEESKREGTQSDHFVGARPTLRSEKA